MRNRAFSSSSYTGPRERRSGSHESNNGEEKPHSRDSRSRSKSSSSSGSEGARPSVAAAAASTTVPERFITELLTGQQEPVAFIAACPLHPMPFPSVIESLQQCIARGAAAAAAAAVAAHMPAAGAAASTATASTHAAAAAASASECRSGFFGREGGPQADEQDPTHEVYVQEVWCSSLCGDDGQSWQQRLQQQFLQFLSDTAALRASARVLLLMRPDVWFERVAAPHTSSSGTRAAAGEAGKQKKRGATPAADDNAAAIAALCEAGLQAGAATGDSDSSSECDAEDAETGAADTESPTSAVRDAAGSTEHGSSFPVCPLFSRRKQRHPRGRKNVSEETEFVVRMLQWLQEALKLQQQLWGVRRWQHPETVIIASGEAGERGGAPRMRGPAGPALAVGVFEHQLPRWSRYHKVFESWLLLPPPRCSFFPTEREFGQLVSCQQEAVMNLQRLMQREPQQLRDAAVGALMAFADSRFSWEEEEELLAIVEDYEQQQQQQARRQLQQGQEQQLQQLEYPAASVVQQTHRGVLSQSKKWKRWHEVANSPKWLTLHREHAMLQREQQLLQEEEDKEEEEEEEREPSVNREVFFPDHASVMLLPEEEQLIDTWKLLACGGHGRKNSNVLQSDRCAAEDSSPPLCSTRAAASARRARAEQTAAASDLAAPLAGHAEPAAAGGRDLRAASKKKEDASAAAAAADATAVSPSAAALCTGFGTEGGGHVGPADGELPAAAGAGDIEGRSNSNNAAVGIGNIDGRSSSSNNSARDDAAVAGAAADAAPAAPAFTGLAPQPTAKSRAGRLCPALQPPGSPRLLCAPPFVVSLVLQQQQQQQRQPCPRLLLPSFQGTRLQCGGGSSAPLPDAFPPLLLRCACCRCTARKEMTSSSYRRTPRDGRKTSSGGDANEVDHRACGGTSSDYGAEGDEAERCCRLRDACWCCYCRDDPGSSAATSGEGFRSGGDGGRRTGKSRRRRKSCTRCAARGRACDSAVGRRRCESSMRREGFDSQRSSRREGRSRRKVSTRQKRGGSKAARERRGGVASDCRCFCLYRRETLWRGLKAGEGRSFLICGPLGSGKSVLLRTLASALSSSSSASWWSSSHDTENVATSSWRLRKKTCGISNHNASDDRLYGTGASCTSGENSGRMKQRDSGCSGHPSGSERCDERDGAPQSSSRQRGGVVFAHVGQLLHGEVGASHRALVQLFSSAAAADAALCLECIDVAFGSAAGVGRQKELWIEYDVGGGSKGCRDMGNWVARGGDETQGLRCGHGGAPEKETPPTRGHESLADDDADNFEKGREELFEDDDEPPGQLDDPVAELQAELMQLFETLVDVFVRQGGVTLFCTVSTRPEFLPLQLLRCFSDTIRLSPMLSDSTEL